MTLLSVLCVVDSQLLQAVASSLGVYYNYTGANKCFDMGQSSVSSLGAQGWGYQARLVTLRTLCHLHGDNTALGCINKSTSVSFTLPLYVGLH